MSLKVQKQTN